MTKKRGRIYFPETLRILGNLAKNRSVPFLLALVLAGCAGGSGPGVEADAVIAGKRYADAPVALGPVRMHLRLREGTAPADEALAPENLELSLGFLAAGEDARVVLRGATLAYGGEGRAAELVTRHQARGDGAGCESARGAGLSLDYWFNATVTGEFFNCVTLGFVTPGRRAGDALELRMEPLNVNGELIRALPVTFARRAPQD